MTTSPSQIKAPAAHRLGASAGQKIDNIDSVDNIDIIDCSPRLTQAARQGPVCVRTRTGRRRALPLVATGCRPRQAFTLIELLIVISIISILLGMLISTVRAVRRYSRQTITHGELKNIEAAWKQFYAHYQYWPDADANIGRFWLQTGEEAKNDARFEMLAPLARMLAGEAVPIIGDPAGITTYNADGIAFFEFSQFNEKPDSDALLDPVNAWRLDRVIRVAGKQEYNTYVVVFDSDGDNQITVELPKEEPETVFRTVVVWTENPEYKEGNERPPRYLKSWME